MIFFHGSTRAFDLAYLTVWSALQVLRSDLGGINWKFDPTGSLKLEEAIEHDIAGKKELEHMIENKAALMSTGNGRLNLVGE